MDKFVKLTGVAAPIDMDDVNTDQIVPARLMRKPRATSPASAAWRLLRLTPLSTRRTAARRDE